MSKEQILQLAVSRADIVARIEAMRLELAALDQKLKSLVDLKRFIADEAWAFGNGSTAQSLEGKGE